MDILEVSLLSDNIPATRSFYRDILDLEVSEDNDHQITVLAGSTKLVFHYADGIEPVYHLAFNIPPNQLNNVLSYLQGRLQILPASETGELIADFKSWNARSVYFNDNNGNILECIARFDLAKYDKEAQTESFIWNISEIGVVTDNVPTSERLLHQSGIPLYTKGPQLEDFSVLGDEKGLIILKDSSRGWMPNNLLPKAFDMAAVLRQDDQLFELTLTDSLHISKLGPDRDV